MHRQFSKTFRWDIFNLKWQNKKRSFELSEPEPRLPVVKSAKDVKKGLSFSCNGQSAKSYAQRIVRTMGNATNAKILLEEPRIISGGLNLS